MKITKIGHSCFMAEHNGCKILADPGTMSTGQNDQTGVDLILVTHQHSDHFDINSIKTILQKNPQAQIITNDEVGKLLEQAGLKYTSVSNGQQAKVKDILIEGMGTKHAYIYSGVPEVENTSYMIADALLVTGDAFFNPNRPVEILTLPISAPWLKISEAIDYTLAIKPKKAFPVHDGMLNEKGQFVSQIAVQFLGKNGIELVLDRSF